MIKTKFHICSIKVPFITFFNFCIMFFAENDCTNCFLIYYLFVLSKWSLAVYAFFFFCNCLVINIIITALSYLEYTSLLFIYSWASSGTRIRRQLNWHKNAWKQLVKKEALHVSAVLLLWNTLLIMRCEQLHQLWCFLIRF